MPRLRQGHVDILARAPPVGARGRRRDAQPRQLLRRDACRSSHAARAAAGTSWLDMFENRDATEVIHAFHSDAAHNMLSRLPKLAVRCARNMLSLLR
jgi:hypothetical protein